MPTSQPTREQLQREVQDLRDQLAERDVQLAEHHLRLTESLETLRAIREGEADALVVSTFEGPRVFVLEGADQAYQTLVEQMQGGAVTLDDNGRVGYCNRRFADLVQRPLEEVIGSHFGRHVIEPDRALVEQLIAQSRGGAAHGEVTLHAAGGGRILADVRLGRIVVNGGPAISMVVTDLTERKRAETALKEANATLERRVAERTAALAESEERVRRELAKLETALASMTDAVCISDAEGRLIHFNDAFATYYRFNNKDECLKTFAEYPDILDVYLPNGELAPLDQWAVPRALRGETATNAEYVLRRKDTGERWVGSYSFAPIRDQSGTIVGSVVAGRDITQRKRAEEALKASEQRLRLAQQAAKAGTWEWDLRTNENVWSEELWPLYGLAPQSCQPSFLAWLDTIHPEDRDRAARTVQDAAGAGAELRVEWRVRDTDGTERWLMSRGQPQRDAAGLITHYVGIVLDITERKQAEEALRRTQASVDGAAEMVAWFTPDGRVRYVNEATCRTLGYSRDELLTMTALDFSPGFTSQQYEEHWRELRERKSFLVETMHRRKDGSEYPAEILVNYVVHGGQEFLFAHGRDITERKRAEEALKASIQEKEVLLKEIHHRVKNNMQVISSIVSLQAGQVDGATRAVLEDVTDRVRSMALVHEKLYQSADLARVDFAEYAESLMNYLWRAHGAAAPGVRLTLDLEPVLVSVNAAVPGGLILNELACNALKHAFRGRSTGEVSVSLRGESAGRVCLCVRDDGNGLPAEFDWRQAKSLGLQLVQILARQLDADVEVSSNRGAAFALTFQGMKA